MTNTLWNGSFLFGDAHAIYRGPAGANAPHKHAAYQLVLTPDSARATVTLNDGQELHSSALMIAPMVTHSLSTAARVTIIYFDPLSPKLPGGLESRASNKPVERIDVSQLAFGEDSPVTHINETLRVVSGMVTTVDSRLHRALNKLGSEPGAYSIEECAVDCGLSSSRLRAIAQAELGLPLSSWLLWRKLERAARELSTGANMADAALAGGFSDQSHFSRSMYQLMGVTPTIAAAALRNLSPP